jgi:hypothetical protein
MMLVEAGRKLQNSPQANPQNFFSLFARSIVDLPTLGA